jgi:hypothetical protein
VFAVLLPSPGKTELASRLRAVVEHESDFCKISCEKISADAQLFGTHGMYRSGDEGSVLNNFLSTHHARDGVVLLDEVSYLVHRGLMSGFLNIFDKGEFEDSRPGSLGKVIDVKRVMFIMTSNQLDPQIKQYFIAHPNDMGAQFTPAVADQLTSSLMPHMVSHFGDPLTSRIDGIVPFVPFHAIEAQVITDQLLRDAVLIRYALPPSDGKHIGHVRVHYTDEFVRILAQRYDPAHGARSILKTIMREIHQVIADAKFAGKLAPFDAMNITTEFPSPAELALHASSGPDGSASGAAASSSTSTGAEDVIAADAPRLRCWRQVRGVHARNEGPSAPTHQIWFDEEQGAMRAFLQQPTRKVAKNINDGPQASHARAAASGASSSSGPAQPHDPEAEARAAAIEIEYERMLENGDF